MKTYAAAYMPEPTPLDMPAQTFSSVKNRRALSTKLRKRNVLWRLAAFVPTLLLTATICFSVMRYLGMGGVTGLEAVVLGLVALSTVWLVFAATSACLGIFSIAFSKTRVEQPPAVDEFEKIALLMPVYNETPWDVFGNASAMLQELAANSGGNAFSLFILSDTRDPKIALQEERAFMALSSEQHDGVSVHYRRRAQNTDKKVGNIRQSITASGFQWKCQQRITNIGKSC